MNTILIESATTASSITFFNDIDVRRCDYCGTPMERHGRAYVCPKQRDEEKRVSQAARASVQATVAERVDGISF